MEFFLLKLYKNPCSPARFYYTPKVAFKNKNKKDKFHMALDFTPSQATVAKGFISMDLLI